VFGRWRRRSQPRPFRRRPYQVRTVL